MIRFVTAVDVDASEELLDATYEFLNELEQLCSVETESPVLKTIDTVDEIVAATTGADLAPLRTVAHSRVHELVFGDSATDISDQLDCSVLLVHPPKSRGQMFLSAIVRRITY